MAIWYDTREPIRCTVWHRAYACEALAEVLGMPAEDIWLEEVPVRAVIAIMALAKASTAPTTPPNTHHTPSMAVAGRKLRIASRGSPAGDR
jgi:hypothetical protein